MYTTEFNVTFNDVIVDVPIEDVYYLLQTLSSMALARQIIDMQFIGRVVHDMFRVYITVLNLYCLLLL